MTTKIKSQISSQAIVTEVRRVRHKNLTVDHLVHVFVADVQTIKQNNAVLQKLTKPVTEHCKIRIKRKQKHQSSYVQLLQKTKPHYKCECRKRKYVNERKAQEQQNTLSGNEQTPGPSGTHPVRGYQNSHPEPFQAKLIIKNVTLKIPQCIVENVKFLIDTGSDLNMIKLSTLRNEVMVDETQSYQLKGINHGILKRYQHGPMYTMLLYVHLIVHNSLLNEQSALQSFTPIFTVEKARVIIKLIGIQQ